MNHPHNGLQNGNIAQVSIDPSLRLNTHSTSGEHAYKELPSWQSFLRNLDRIGGSLPSSIDNPYTYYLEDETGHFYKASGLDTGTMFAGMAVSPTNDGGLSVDAMYCKDARSETVSKGEEEAVATLVATSVDRILNKQVFDNFVGHSGLPARKYLDLSFDNLGPALQRDSEGARYRYNWGFLRGISDYAIAHKRGYRIALPNQVIEVPEPVSEDYMEDKIRGVLPALYSGVIVYRNEDEPGTTHQEFYRRRNLLGVLRTVPGEDGEPVYEASSTSVEEIEFPKRGLGLEYDTAKQSRFLKLLAEHDPKVKSLVLNG